MPVISQRTREHVTHVYGIQHSACFIRNEDFQRDDILSRENGMREHFAASQYRLREMLNLGQSDQLWAGEPWRVWVTDEPNGSGQPIITIEMTAR